MKTVAVITGDIIDSKEIENKEHLINSLNNIFQSLESNFSFYYPFEIFRGDSIQGVLKHPKYTLRILYLLKSGLITKSLDNHLYKIRLSAGIGSIIFLQNDIKISNGRGFELSGTELDKMKFTRKTIAITTENEKRNAMLIVMNQFSEVIFQKWSKQAAEVVYLSLLNDYTQKEIAQILNISQSAVQQRLSAAHFDTINQYIRYFENLNWK